MSKTSVSFKPAAVDVVDVWHLSLGKGDPRSVYRIDQRLSAGETTVEAHVSLNREQAEWVRDQLTVILNETDPAYLAHMDAKMEPASARDNDGGFSSHGPEPLPATDDEWKARLAEGGAS